MIISWTDAFKVLRDTKVKERLLRNNLTFEYLARQLSTMNCSLCYKPISIKGLLCEGCFYKLHPPSIDFKTSIAVKYALELQRIRINRTSSLKPSTKDESVSFKLLDISNDSSLRDLSGKVYSLESASLSYEERIILSSIKLKIQMETTNKWAAIRIKSMIDLIDEQLNILRLKYLICLRNLRLDDVLLLKKHIIEIRKHRDSLFEMLGNKLII
ncbi:hypothetical protein EROM_091980 [Encephalitozoon romaleae SJ-2008]|uniref:Uncharacterized protein n=1 Tax=Encephalitozoon romaleae (strain SJ-2008) TaxID=1178016 RepID=I7ATL6_ENCRO|nr:hypothetical protein EROM_091980 [Encephalitozoon romaleae SJ-2008]AFN83812.1 hypothetical protein EROM_091980 [Encephalitozoon romaleae SJ-2008]